MDPSAYRARAVLFLHFIVSIACSSSAIVTFKRYYPPFVVHRLLATSECPVREGFENSGTAVTVCGSIIDNTYCEWSAQKRPREGVHTDFVVLQSLPSNTSSSCSIAALRSCLRDRFRRVKRVWPNTKWAPPATISTDMPQMEDQKHWLNASMPTMLPAGRLPGFNRVFSTLATDGTRGAAGVRAPAEVHAQVLWDRNIRGMGIKVGIMDTGVLDGQGHRYLHVTEASDWTTDTVGTNEDSNGHGTFVSGMISSTHPDCPGLAPDASLYVMRVFNTHKQSYTSWLLDALNYALAMSLDVLSLSVGGPDTSDTPFEDKVQELILAGMIVVSAVGNDGPVWGSAYSPASSNGVVAVGGLDSDGQAVARFSSRGPPPSMPGSHAVHFKPDIVFKAANLAGLSLSGGCRVLSGTSVAAPAVAGILALLLSGVAQTMGAPTHAARTYGQAVIQQLYKDALPIKASVYTEDVVPSILEQGAGVPGRLSTVLDHVLEALRLPLALQGRVSLKPSELLLDGAHACLSSKSTSSRWQCYEACGYMWPLCSQPLYAGSAPLVLHVSVLNSLRLAPLPSLSTSWHLIPNAANGGGITAPFYVFDERIHASLLEASIDAFAPALQLERGSASLCSLLSSHLDAPAGRVRPSQGLTVQLEVLESEHTRYFTPSDVWDSAESLVNCKGKISFWLSSPPLSSQHSAALLQADTALADRISHLFDLSATGLPLVPREGVQPLSVDVLVEGTEKMDAGFSTLTLTPCKDDGQVLCIMALHHVSIPLKVLVSTHVPPQNKRLLFDVFHSLSYPLDSYMPRDDLELLRPLMAKYIDTKSGPLDWRGGDSLMGNFRWFYKILRKYGFAVITADKPWTCYALTQYGILFSADAEDYWLAEEVQAVQEAVSGQNNVTLIVFADWYDSGVFNASDANAQPIFHDDGTRSYWSPVVGGANVPALNAVLSPFGVFLGGRPFTTVLPWGTVDPRDGNADAQPVGNMRAQRKGETRGDNLRSGGEQRGGEGEGDYIPPYPFFDGVGVYALPNADINHAVTRVWGSTMLDHSLVLKPVDQQTVRIPALVLTQLAAAAHTGRVAVFGDSACIDDNYIQVSTAAGRKVGLTSCTHLVDAMLEFAAGKPLYDVAVPHVTPMTVDAWMEASTAVADGRPFPMTAQEALQASMATVIQRQPQALQRGQDLGGGRDAGSSTVEPELDAELFLHRKPGTMHEGHTTHNNLLGNGDDHGMKALETGDVSTALNGMVSKLKAITSRLAFGLSKPMFQHGDHVHDASTQASSSSQHGRMVANRDGASAEVLGGPDSLPATSRTCAVIRDPSSAYRYCKTP